VVLDFGQPWSQNGAYGANIFDSTYSFHTTDEIADAVRWYGYGFWDCTHNRSNGPHLRIIIGVNNYQGTNVNAGHGAAWAEMVKGAWAWAQSQPGYADRFTIGAGNDMEVGWAGPAQTRDWIAGYQSAPAHLPYYDFGDCAGCPYSGDPNAQPTPYSLQDIFYKSYGAEAANPLPEIYATNGVNAQQWWFVAQTAYNNSWGAMTFRGAMTQRGDCDQKRKPGVDPCFGTDNPPAQGWAFLWDALHQQGSTLGAINPLPWSTDIRCQDVAQAQTTTVSGNGHITASPARPTYPKGQVVPFTAAPDPGWFFTGWIVDGQRAGWANPLTVTMDRNHSVQATFSQPAAFSDVSSSNPYYNAIIQISARKIINGYGDGTFGPSDPVLRAQAAAFIARAMPSATTGVSCVTLTWDCETWTDYTFSDIGVVDPGLQRDIRTLAHYNVARGYGDGTYHPTDNVIYAASISLISRAMIAHGYWQPQNTGSCPGVPTDHCQDVMTYSYYTAGVGGAPSVPD